MKVLPKVDREVAKILTSGELELTLIKNGLKIRYSAELRQKLQDLNAKINLVNKANKGFVSADVGDELEQDVAFKNRDDFDILDYELQIRRRNLDPKKSELMYSIDFDDEAKEELEHSMHR